MVLKDYNLVTYLKLNGFNYVKKDIKGFHYELKGREKLYKALYSNYKKVFKPFVDEVKNLKRTYLYS